jgi:cold shock CspA family protein
VTLKDTYGFIIDNEDNSRWFHKSYVKGVSFDDLEVGDRVEFTPFVGPRGRRAEDVRRIHAVRRSAA